MNKYREHCSICSNLSYFGCWTTFPVIFILLPFTYTKKHLFFKTHVSPQNNIMGNIRNTEQFQKYVLQSVLLNMVIISYKSLLSTCKCSIRYCDFRTYTLILFNLSFSFTVNRVMRLHVLIAWCAELYSNLQYTHTHRHTII